MTTEEEPAKIPVSEGNYDHVWKGKSIGKVALAIRRIFSLVDMITKPKFSNCPNVFKIGLFR